MGQGGGGVNAYQAICCNFTATRKKGPLEDLLDRGQGGGGVNAYQTICCNFTVTSKKGPLED